MALASVDMLTGAASGVHVISGTEADVAAAIDVLETREANIDVRGAGVDRRVAVGAGASASGDSGADASPRYQAVAVGAGASASGPSSVAVGGGASASAEDAVQLGAGVNTTPKSLKFRGAVLFVVAADGDAAVATLGSGFPAASSTAPGAVKIGANISVGPDGTISVAAVPTKVSQLENDSGFVAARMVTVCRVVVEGETFTCTRFSETEWRFLYYGRLQYIRHLADSGLWEFGFIDRDGNYAEVASADGSADDAVVSFPIGVTATFSEETDQVAYASQVPPSLVREAVVSSDGSQLTLMLSNGSAVVFSGGVQERIAGSDGRFIKYDGTIRVVGSTTWLYSRTLAQQSFVDVPSVQFGPDEWRWVPESIGMTSGEHIEYIYLRYVDGKWEYGYGFYNTLTGADSYTSYGALGTDRAATTLSYEDGSTFRYSESLVDRTLATKDQVVAKADEFTAWITTNLPAGVTVTSGPEWSELDGRWKMSTSDGLLWEGISAAEDAIFIQWYTEAPPYAPVSNRKRVLLTGDADKLTDEQKAVLSGGPYLPLSGGTMNDGATIKLNSMGASIGGGPTDGTVYIEARSSSNPGVSASGAINLRAKYVRKNNKELATEASLAPEYSPSSAYSVGSIVCHDGNIYQCKTAIADGGEPWNAEHWDLRKLDDFFTKSNSLLTGTIDEEVISKGTAPDAHLEAPTDEHLKLILADSSVAYDSAKALPYKLTSAIGDRVVATMTLTAASTDITLPTISADDTTVKDFILDVTNAYAVEGVATDAGINIPRTDFKLVTRDGESLTAVTTVKAGRSAFICFTQKSPVVVDGTTYPCWCVIQLPFGDPS